MSVIADEDNWDRYADGIHLPESIMRTADMKALWDETNVMISMYVFFFSSPSLQSPFPCSFVIYALFRAERA